MSAVHPFNEFPKHLHHPHSRAKARIVHNKVEEKEARDLGYSEEYVHKDYPKHVTDYRGVTVTVESEEEEQAVEAAKAPSAAPADSDEAISADSDEESNASAD